MIEEQQGFNIIFNEEIVSKIIVVNWSCCFRVGFSKDEFVLVKFKYIGGFDLLFIFKGMFIN